MANLTVHDTSIPGVLFLELPVHGDRRGWFKENWQRDKMLALGLPDFGPVQNNISYNGAIGTTRGIHAEPWDKYVSVATGRIFGAWVDLRAGDTFGTVFTAEIGPGQAIFVPHSVGNSYQELEPGTAYTYLVNDHWSPKADYTFCNLADEALGIEWPVALSDERHYIVRTTWVIGDGANFVATMRRLAASGVNPAVVDDQIGRLTYTSDLAAGIADLLTSGAPYGTYNVTSGGKPKSWYEIAQEVYAEAGRDPARVTPTSTAEYGAGKELAPRPRHSTLARRTGLDHARNHPGRRYRLAAPSPDPWSQQAADARVRQADDLLPAVDPHAGGNSRHLDHHDAARR